jgi:hypothetical protein
MSCGVIEPTGNTGTLFGNTARIDLSTFGGLASAGNSFSASAPPQHCESFSRSGEAR